jgi:hypothetical protein
LKRHLLEAIDKLARYYSAASDLVCATRDKGCQGFQKIEIKSFEVPSLSVSKKKPFEKVLREIELIHIGTWCNSPSPSE